MKVFISWSGELSHKVAQEFRDWLPKVIQRVRPFISSQDIDKGNRWNAEMVKQLQESSYGILCITKDNLQAPWLNFEAGALSMKFPDKSQVTPFLFNVKGSDIKEGHPLLQFQYVKYEKEDVKKMLKGMNKACEPDCLEESDLNEVFDVWWPKLEDKLKAILKDADIEDFLSQIEEDSPENKQERILEDLLELVRSQSNSINDLKELLPNPLQLRAQKLSGRLEAIRNVASDGLFRINVKNALNTIKLHLTEISRRLANIDDEPPFDFVKQTTAELLKRIDDITEYLDAKNQVLARLTYLDPNEANRILGAD